MNSKFFLLSDVLHSVDLHILLVLKLFLYDARRHGHVQWDSFHRLHHLEKHVSPSRMRFCSYETHWTVECKVH